MSKWTDDAAIEAYDELRNLGRYGLGRAILDLRERAEKAEARCAALEAEVRNADLFTLEVVAELKKLEKLLKELRNA